MFCYGSACTTETIADMYMPDDKEALTEKLKILKALKVKDDLTGTLKNSLRRWQHTQ